MAYGTDCKLLCFVVSMCHITDVNFRGSTFDPSFSLYFAVVVVDVVAIVVAVGGLLHSLLEDITRMI